MAAEENVKVAVRLRPFLPNLKRETDGKSKRIVRMDELSSSVCLQNPEDSSEIHKFTYDSVLWSFDGYSEQSDGCLTPENKAVSEEIYCDQKQVYDEIGKEMVQNLWNGHNGTIFTFGEGKSGKSWTLLGIGSNKGIVSQSLSDLFKGMRDKEKQLQQTGSALEVRLSMAEIYNERVKDLLPASSSANTKLKSVAKIREHSKKGFYIEGIRNVLVINNEDIQQRLEEGLLNRAVYLTSINARSGYSTTYIGVTLVQKIRNHRGDEMTRMGTLEFIDLPACEFKMEDVEEKNDFSEEDYYFEEGSSNNSSAILKSVNLKQNGIEYFSNCVDLLIEASIGKYTDTIPFYKHSLTKIMRNAFLGNARSYMIATISPSESSYKNSLLVLKIAEKVRMLTTRSVPNEEVTSKLIRELKGDTDKIRKLISLGELETNADLSNRLARASMMSSSERDSMKKKIVEDMKAQVRENEKEIRNLQQSFEERLKPFKTEKNDLGKKIENDRKSKCHLYNLNEDSQITGKIIHIIPLGTIEFGQNNSNNNSNKGKESGHFITFSGPGILEHHGSFSYNTKDGKFSIKPSGPNARILVNETPIQFDTILGHNDRVTLGGIQVWLYQNPKETWLEKFTVQDKVYWETVMEEVAIKSDEYRRLSSDCHGAMPDSVQNQLLDLIPSLEDARSMISDLNQNFVLQPTLQYPIDVLLLRGSEHSSSTDLTKASSSETVETNKSQISPKLLMKVENTADGTFHYWSLDKFYERLEILRDSYVQYLDDGDVPLKDVVAFKERSDVDMPIGYSIICLEPLAYQINIENSQVPILDYITFEPVGSVGFSLVFCDETSGEKVNDEERFIESPEELLDENLTVLMELQDLRNVTLQFKDIYCKYNFLDEDEDLTKYLDSKASNFGGNGTSGHFNRKFFIGPVTDNTLNLMLTQNLVLRFYGKQRAHKLLNLMGSLQNSTNGISKGFGGNLVRMERTEAQLKIKEIAELRHQRRLNAMKALVTQSETFGEEMIPISMVKNVFQAKSQKLVDMSLEEHKEALTFVPEEPPPKQLPPELKALKRFSEICCVV